MRKLYAAGDGVEALDNIHFVYRIPPLMAGGAAQLDAVLAEWSDNPVIIDTVRAFSRGRARNTGNAVQSDYDFYSPVRDIAEKHATGCGRRSYAQTPRGT
jgi:hypothetical protein